MGQLFEYVIIKSRFCEYLYESPLDSKEIKPVNPKGNQLQIFIGRIDAKAEAPVLWPPDEKNQLPGKDLGAGKDKGQEEKWTTEDETVGWHHQFNRHEFEQTPESMRDREAWLPSMGLQRVGHH